MRYLILGGAAYYAAGGARDLITGVDDYHHAKDYAENIIGCFGYELGDLVPVIAAPHKVDNVVPVTELE